MTTRRESILASAAVAAVLLAVLLSVHLSFDPESAPPSRQPVASVTEALPEYVDFLESLNTSSPSDPAAAAAPLPEDNASVAAPEGGQDLANTGTAGNVAPETTTHTPAPVRRRERTEPAHTGPSESELAEEHARRRAERDVTNAFDSPDGNATATNDSPVQGNSGAPDGTETPVNGSGSGTVGGGWIMPSYNKLPSTEVGSIRLRATIDSSGAVIKVEQIGGRPPAAANSALVSACTAEIQSRRFTRTDSNPPPSATAFITYIFK